MAISTPVLDLTTTNPQIRIDGEFYALRVQEDLSILSNAEHFKRWKRIDDLRLKPARTPKEQAEFSSILKESCTSVLDAPAAVIGRLSQRQQLGVVSAFFQQVAIVDPNRDRQTLRTSKK